MSALSEREEEWLTSACFTIACGGGDESTVDEAMALTERADHVTTTRALLELFRGNCVSEGRRVDGSAIASVGRALAEKCIVCDAIQDERLLALGSCELLYRMRQTLPDLFDAVRDQVFAETGVSSYGDDDEPNENLPSSLLLEVADLTVNQKWSVLNVFDAMRRP